MNRSGPMESPQIPEPVQYRAQAPSVSVVVPAYNVERYVREALESIALQSVAPEEVIVVDDGSTDGTARILAEFAELANFKVVFSPNSGPGPSRNFGRMLASSDYVYFFDSDDLLDRGFVKRVKEVAVHSSWPDVILFAGEAFLNEGFSHKFFPTYKRTLEGHFGPGDGLLAALLDRNESSPSPCLYVTRRSMWSEHRLNFPPIVHEDEAVFFPLLASSRSTVVVPEVYFKNRIRPASIMTSGASARNVAGFLRALNETHEFMLRNPDKVAPDLWAWRNQLRKFGLRYINLCRETGCRIAWGSLVPSVLSVRQPSYLLRLLFYGFSPVRLRAWLRSFKKRG